LHSAYSKTSHKSNYPQQQNRNQEEEEEEEEGIHKRSTKFFLEVLFVAGVLFSL